MITHKLEMDLHHCGITPTVDAAQGDEHSRTLEIFFYNNGKDFLLPENLAVLIRYRKADGKGGEYDTLPDNTPAWYASKNKLTIQLAPQVLTFPGYVSMTITLVSDGKTISTFPLGIHVLPEARSAAADSEDYFRISGFLVAPGNADAGQFLKIASVNNAGRVTAVEASTIQQIPSDWNAAPGEPGHILNRPFYSVSGVETEVLPQISPTYYEEDGGFFLFDPLNLTAGQEYAVYWNGIQYPCIAWEYPIADDILGVCLGDRDMVDSNTPGTGEPFAILAVPPEYVASMGIGVMIVAFDGSTELTLSITTSEETVVPIPKKYLDLGDLKAQKAYTIDLDNLTADVSLSTLVNMDPGELQATVRFLYQGVEHGAVVTLCGEEDFDGVTVQAISFAVLLEYGTERPGIIPFRWDNINGMELGSVSRPVPEIEGSHLEKDAVFYARPKSGGEPSWCRMEDLHMKGIRLRSSTSGSNKQFWITVDDSGTLSATLDYL